MIIGMITKYRTYIILATVLKEKLGIPQTDRIQSFEIQRDMNGDDM